MRVAVVGAGISGIACARELVSAGHDVRVLDRGRLPGGRMATRELDGRAVDLGASYFTVSDERFRAVVDDWERRGLARPWTAAFYTATPEGLGAPRPGPVRYGTPAGLRSLVEDLAAGLVVHRGEVRQVGPGPVVDGQAYDVVVLAMPDPQALRLLDPSHAAARTALGDRRWEPVLALAVRYAQRTWAFDGVFVNGHGALSWVADDGRRRGDGAPVLVAHSTSGLAERLADPDAAAPALVAALRAVLGVPAPQSTFMQRWTYAKPVGTREQPYGLFDGVGLCGDGWGAAKVETAWRSGALLGQALSGG